MQILLSLLHPTARSSPPFFQSQSCAALWRADLGAMAGDFAGPGGLSRARKCLPALLLFLSPPKSLAYIWRLPPSVPLSSSFTRAAFALSDRRSRCGGAAGHRSSSSPGRRSESAWLVLSCSSYRAPWIREVLIRVDLLPLLSDLLPLRLDPLPLRLDLLPLRLDPLPLRLDLLPLRRVVADLLLLCRCCSFLRRFPRGEIPAGSSPKSLFLW
jgi:hypothetical protein